MTTTTLTAISGNSTRYRNSLTDIITSLGKISLQTSLPDWSIVDTPAKVSNLVDTLHSLQTPADHNSEDTPPALYIDLQRTNVSRHGHISLLQLYVLPLQHIYLLDVQTLGKTAFTTPGTSALQATSTHPLPSLKTILESPTTPKIFFDIRHASDALYHQFDISLSGTTDLQLMELAARATGNSNNTLSSINGGSSRSPSPRSTTPPVASCSPISSPCASPSDTNTCPSPIQRPRARTRSLRHLNNLPRCVSRDADLSMGERMAWERWLAWLRGREQVVVANRELERLDRMVFLQGGGGVDGAGYRRFRDVDGGVEARPVSEEVVGGCVLSVRFLPRLWGFYEGRMGEGGEEGDRRGSNGDIWRGRVKEATRERVEVAKTREGYTWCGKGRGKLMMLAPFGWDSLT